MAESEHWVIYNGTLGAVDTAWVGHIEQGQDGVRRAFFEEPYDMVGPLDLDELEARGVIAFAACLIMSPKKWREDQADLRREGWAKRRAFAAQARENQQRTWQSRGPGRAESSRWGRARRFPLEERAYRAILSLPIQGTLAPADIQGAFRRLAKHEHPDTGGSHERFVRITEARDALLSFAS